MKGREAVKTVKWFLQFTIPLTPWNVFYLLFYFPLIVTMPFSLSPTDVGRHRSYWHFQSKGCLFLPLDFHFFFLLLLFNVREGRVHACHCPCLLLFYLFYFYLLRDDQNLTIVIPWLIWSDATTFAALFSSWLLKFFNITLKAFYFYLFKVLRIRILSSPLKDLLFDLSYVYFVQSLWLLREKKNLHIFSIVKYIF